MELTDQPHILECGIEFQQINRLYRCLHEVTYENREQHLRMETVLGDLILNNIPRSGYLIINTTNTKNTTPA